MYQYINAVTEMHRYRDAVLNHLLDNASYDQVFFDELQETIFMIQGVISNTSNINTKRDDTVLDTTMF